MKEARYCFVTINMTTRLPQDTVLLLCYKETLIPHASAYVSCLQEAFKIAYPIIT